MASSPMKKSRSSTPRFDARCPGFDGTEGPPRVVWAAGPLVAIAVGNTLVWVSDELGEGVDASHKEGSEFPA